MRDTQSFEPTHKALQVIFYGSALGSTLALPDEESVPEFSGEALLRLLALGCLHGDAASLRAALGSAPTRRGRRRRMRSG